MKILKFPDSLHNKARRLYNTISCQLKCCHPIAKTDDLLMNGFKDSLRGKKRNRF